MKYTNEYPDVGGAYKLLADVCDYADLKCEFGAAGEVKSLIEEGKAYFHQFSQRLKEIPNDREMELAEPNGLSEIKALSTGSGEPLLSAPVEDGKLYNKMLGAIVGRIVGCLLGVPVEGMTVENMEGWCEFIGVSFPFTDYLPEVERPQSLNAYHRYRHEYRRSEMDGCAPVDDDIAYSQIGLLIMEEYGLDFTTADVGRAWSEYIPYACTAEEVAIKNLKKNIPIDKVAEIDNPYCQLIGAAIRSDPFGWAAAGYPQRAAEMAYRDGYLSHRRNGIYGEMFLAAAQSAAFAVKTPLEAINIALGYIPKSCRLHNDIEWTLSQCDKVNDYKDARRLTDERFSGMHAVHTVNNLCLIVFALTLAEKNDCDYIKCLSQTVAMGLDNDCTAASVGSILGAVIGYDKMPQYLYSRFNDTADTYLNGAEKFSISDMARRFIALNRRLYER